MKDLKKLDRKIAINIINKVSNYLANDPIHIGKPLSGNFNGLMRYRFGDYRIIYIINHSEIVIEIIRIEHRKNIYE